MSGDIDAHTGGYASDADEPRTSGERKAAEEGIDLTNYRRRWTTLVVLCLSLTATMLANTSLNVALPYLSEDLGAATAAQQWFSNAYALVFAGLLFTTSSLADRYGRKPMLQAGLVIFGAVSLYVWLFVSSSGELIAARGLLGVGAAMIMPVTLSILTSVFPSSQRAQAVGVWAAVSGAGSALGPVLAGVLVEYYSWESVFAINVPVVVVAVVAGIRYVPGHGTREVSEGGHGGLDVGGAVLSTAGITLVVYALIQAQHVGWTAPRTFVLAAIGLVLVAAFVLWERRQTDPMFDVRLFRNSGFSASAIALTLVFFSLIGVFFSLSQTLQLIYGYTPLSSSLAMLPISVMMVIFGPTAPRIAARLGPRVAVTMGLLVLACGMAGLSTLEVDSGYAHLLVPLVFTAAGMGLTMSPATDQLMANVPRSRAGMGSATNDVTREVGASLGIAVLGSVLGTIYAGHLAGAAQGLPDQLRELATSSLPGGLVAAAQLGPRGAEFAQQVMQSWIDGVQVAQLAGTALILLAAAVAWFWLPRASQPAPAPASAGGNAGVDAEQAPVH